MRKTILTILGSVLLAGSLVQTAAAAEHHHTKHWAHQRAPIAQPFRDSNAYDRNSGYDRYRSAEPDWSRYEGGAISAPAGQ
jgi:Ni/Co efflux regulator RcnB